MARKIFTLALISLAFVGPPASCNTMPFPTPDGSRSQQVVLIERRGKFYRYDDLMNPAYRAQSDDPFIRNFDPNVYFAEQLANVDEISDGNNPGFGD